MVHKRIYQNLGQLKKLNSFSYEQHCNMILKNLKIFSQNVWKNNFLINTILEINQSFDIIFIQEPLWTTLRIIPSSKNYEGIPLVGIPNHPNWLIFAREPCLTNQESLFISMLDFLLSIFHFEKTLLITKIFYLLPFSMTMSFFGSWTFILILLIPP